jgi:hypothetical protein
VGLYIRQSLQDNGNHVPAATKNCWMLRFLCGPCRIKGESLGLYILQSLQDNGNHVPAATKNCWMLRFLCGPCRMKGQ